MDQSQEIKKLNQKIQQLTEELESQKSNYKQLSTELGQTIFKNEDLELENRKLKQKIDNLTEKNKKLEEFKKEIESSATWKLKKMFK